MPKEKKEKVGRLALAKEIEESLKLIEEKYNLLDACDKDFMEKRHNNKSFVFSTPHPKLFEEEGFNYPFSTFDYLSKTVEEQIFIEKETAKEIKDKYKKLEDKTIRPKQNFLTGLFAVLACITSSSGFKHNSKELTDNYNAVIEWERKMQEYEKNYSKAREEYNYKIAERDKKAEERIEKAKQRIPEIDKSLSENKRLNQVLSILEKNNVTIYEKIYTESIVKMHNEELHSMFTPRIVCKKWLERLANPLDLFAKMQIEQYDDLEAIEEYDDLEAIVEKIVKDIEEEKEWKRAEEEEHYNLWKLCKACWKKDNCPMAPRYECGAFSPK